LPIVAAALLIACIAMPASSRAQAAAIENAKPSFDVASIKLNKSGSSSLDWGTQLIRDACVLQDFQVVGGPGWTSESD
jgi:hypothetical protein